MARRLTQREYIAVIAVTSAVALVLGVWFKPKSLPTPTISAEETLRLQTLTERRSLENLAVFTSEVAGGIQPGLVWLDEIALTGLVWNQEGLIVTAGPNYSSPEEVTALTAAGNIAVKAQVLSVDFRTASLQAQNGAQLQPVRKGTPEGLPPGSWIIQVARQAKGNYLFTPGVYEGIASTRCGSFEYQALQSNLPLTEPALGGGLFDVNGNLLAVVVRCDDQFAALVPAEVDRELARAASFEGHLLQSYGLEVTGLDDVSRRYFRTNAGVLVKAVTDGQLADAAGLEPGDVITSLDKVSVLAPDDLRPLTAPEDRTRFQLDVWRNRRIIRIDLQPASSHTPGERHGADGPGVVLTNPSRGYLVGTVLRGSRAERASIRAGDHLLLVDGKPPGSLTAARKAISGDNREPMFLLIQRGLSRIGTFLD